MFRTGIGFDAHRFSEGRKLFLGGIEIPYHKGLSGHSDADVLIHAICDSLLGAMGKNDIGYYFPDDKEEFRDIPGLTLLSKVKEFLESEGYKICNIDTVIICEQPRIGPHIEMMKKSISECLDIETGKIGIKATTTEKMGFTGRGEGIAAKSIALIRRL
jgi:2-C-methyl-D-erythritol 2,4-cyclodiphosphate synthase